MAEEMDFSTFYKDKVSPLIVKIILEILFYVLHLAKTASAGLIVLFFLATSATILDTTATMKQIWLYLGQYWGGQSSLDAETASSMTVRLDIICGTVTFGLYVISNFIADLILREESGGWAKRQHQRLELTL
ncbi:hypothetical protein HHX47_DHR4001019 [Lentinula edodes]|nr:hypothetical protein HHX47_DHR4001019 [Lentinula edodes]